MAELKRLRLFPALLAQALPSLPREATHIVSYD